MSELIRGDLTSPSETRQLWHHANTRRQYGLARRKQRRTCGPDRDQISITALLRLEAPIPRVANDFLSAPCRIGLLLLHVTTEVIIQTTLLLQQLPLLILNSKNPLSRALSLMPLHDLRMTIRIRANHLVEKVVVSRFGLRSHTALKSESAWTAEHPERDAERR